MDCPAVVPVTVAWKVTVPPGVVAVRDGVTATETVGAAAATVKLTCGPSCQARALSWYVVYEYQDPSASVLR